MSRKTLFSDDRLTVITGVDHALGLFYQIYDKEFIDETSEGEGLIFEWSELFGIETNLTGISSKNSPDEIIKHYVLQNTKILKSRLN